ncbi:helix-turn-helix domain-containing protein [Streptomyces meridianus]|uniref:Helix-turn-helix transcriptional regulator n=1 Tax=Streptomyces meridianus TaxID=2938945 RepID=A0ABT0X2T8_9ACTN|nr:helix-turn-helix transcriptional regulator [Streptomyces meridianus]MCM2576833.1 helix-turn-helix transcriptional regulator [Streptomyces meridianus]
MAGVGGPSERRPEPAEDRDETVDLFRAMGKQVKLLRERAGLTQRELGDRLGYGEDQISSLERGRRIPQPEFLDAADELLGAGGLLKAAKDDVVRAKAKARVKHPSWFRDFARLEAEAVERHDYETQTIPGLLQTEDYARAIFSIRQPLLDERTIEERVSARIERQEIFQRWPAPTLSFTLEEATLHRPYGGAKVLREQLRQLLSYGQLRNVRLQVMPTVTEDNPGFDGPLVLLTPKGRQQVAYLEVQGHSRLITDSEEVRVVAARYGIIRAQALTPRESLALIEKLVGDL